MDIAAIIDYDYKFSSFQEFLFKIGKLNEKYFCKEILIDGKIIRIFKFPASARTLMNKRNFLKIIKKFTLFLKNKGITNLIFSDECLKIVNIKENLKKDFKIFNGKSIINFEFQYIIKKCIKSRENSEIVIFSNDFNDFNEIFNLIFKNFRVSALVTEYKNLFISFIDEIFNEYGILVNIYDKEEFLENKDFFYININMDSDDFIFDMDLKKLKIIFYRNPIFDKISNYFKIFDNTVLEFLIYNINGDIEKSKITDFFKKYDIKIVRIYKK
ncbi:MAG: hypothetical protein E7407_00180 [Ruminococcaceae bacterium]|nr:hypothetical protein [Oscillospiraceae bacterium]